MLMMQDVYQAAVHVARGDCKGSHRQPGTVDYCFMSYHQLSLFDALPNNQAIRKSPYLSLVSFGTVPFC